MSVKGTSSFEQRRHRDITEPRGSRKGKRRAEGLTGQGESYVRRHAKAASAGSTMRKAAGVERVFRGASAGLSAAVDDDGSSASLAWLVLSLALALACFCGVAPASAATTTQRPLLFTFHPAGSKSANSIAVDNETGDVYVGVDETGVFKSSAAGSPANFSATGAPSLSGEFSNLIGVAVDNSGGASQGRLLVSQFGDTRLTSYAPDGELQWTFAPNGQLRDVAVDAAGHPWTSMNFTSENVQEYESTTGSPPSSIFSFNPIGFPVKLDVDASGNVYVVEEEAVNKYVGGTLNSTLDARAEDVSVDQTSPSGHVFTVDSVSAEHQLLQVNATAGQYHLTFDGEETTDLPFEASAEQVKAALEALPAIGGGDVEVYGGYFGTAGSYDIFFSGLLAGANVDQLGCEDGTTPLSGGSGCTVSTSAQGSLGNFEEYDSSGTLLGTYGTDILGQGDKGIAYNPTLDRVYVLENGANPSVAAFGPAVTGTAPDATIEDPSAVGVSSATFHGIVNPQGTTSEWHFEWRRPGQSWGEASSSPPQSLPADSSGHPVEYTTDSLHGSTTYQVRLIAVNTGNQLVGTSAAKTFTTSKAAQAPAVTINQPSAITAHTAKITGTLNPEGDTAEWRVQTSTDPECESGFEDEPLQELMPGSSSPVDVEYELTGLLPRERYCVRIVATNSALTDEIQQLTVDASGGTFMLSFEGESTAWTGEGKVEPESTTIGEVSTTNGIPTPGEAISGIGIKPNTKVESYNANAKTITLSQPTAASVLSHKVSLTAALAFDASAEAVQNALDALPTIGGAGGSVAVTGGPGDVGGTNPYEITFHGSLAKKDVPQLVAGDIDLSGGGESATVSTTTPGVPEAISETKEFETLDALPTQVFTAYAAPRTDTSARLNGYVNPQGGEATYRFEYSEDGSNWTTLPDHQSRPVREQIVVGQELTGLTPNTTYQYRFLVENGAGLLEGDEKTFTTRTTAEMQLPQRGIELVNQPDKGNQNIVTGDEGAGIVAPDGNRAIWTLLGGAPGGNTGTHVNFISTRTSNGWISRAIVPPAEEQVGGGSLAYKLNNVTPDLRHFVMRAFQPEAIFEERPSYVRIDDEQHQEVLASLAKKPTETPDSDITDDGAHVVIFNYETLQLEEVGSRREVVSIMPDGTPSECGVKTFAKAPSDRQARPGYHRMATTDASRVYFQAVPNGKPCDSGPRAIFYRDRDAEETIEVDPGTTTSGVSEMIRATPEGRDLYFLTAISHSPDDINGKGDIYRWDADSNQYTCLTCIVADPGLATDPNGGFAPVLVSDDFSHIYFKSRKQLIAGYGASNEGNVYALSDGELHFVTDAGEHGPVTSTGQLSNDGNVLVWYEQDGRSQLTSDELADQCSGAATVGGVGACRESYRYEDSTQSLECISCAPRRMTVSSSGVGANSAFVISASADGSTVAFITKEPLVSEDINNSHDVYEWRDGAIGLVTDGETVFPTGRFSSPGIYGLDKKGDNIFFNLDQPGLTGYEQDGFSNLYDARVGGGFPRPREAAHCVEESCQGPLQSAPPQSGAGSAGLAGSGNVPLVRNGRCAGKRGKARGRCLHRHKHHRNRRRRSAHRSAQRIAGGAK
jgi:hypothetical protein